MSDTPDLPPMNFALLIAQIVSIVPDRWAQNRLKALIITAEELNQQSLVTTILRALMLLVYVHHQMLQQYKRWREQDHEELRKLREQVAALRERIPD